MALPFQCICPPLVLAALSDLSEEYNQLVASSHTLTEVEFWTSKLTGDGTLPRQQRAARGQEEGAGRSRGGGQAPAAPSSSAATTMVGRQTGISNRMLDLEV